jgi:hypothetical protein
MDNTPLPNSVVTAGTFPTPSLAQIAPFTGRRPCAFLPECPDQCPDFIVDFDQSSRCACGHLFGVHREVPVEHGSTSIPPAPTPPQPPSVSQSSWRDTINNRKGKGKPKVGLSEARREAVSGFRPEQGVSSKSATRVLKVKGLLSSYLPVLLIAYIFMVIP